MSRTPLHNRALTDGKDKTPQGSRVLPGRDRTPLANRVLRDRTPHGDRIQEPSLDQELLDVLRSLNLAVAAVAQARDRRFSEPAALPTPEFATKALIHLKDAAQHLDRLRRTLPG